MSDPIVVYQFESAAGEDDATWTTQDPVEAKEYALKNDLRVIAMRYELSASKVVWDFTIKPIVGFRGENR